MLEHINFNRKIGQRTLNDDTLSNFVQNFEKIPLRDENFEFPDLLGAAYEYLIKFFADSAGKAKEQELVARRLDATTSRIAAEEQQVSLLTQVQSRLMHDLLTGRVRVKRLSGGVTLALAECPNWAVRCPIWAP